MSSPDVPSPDPNIGEAAKTNAEVANRALDLSERAYDDQQALVNEFSPLLKAQIELQAQQAQKSIDRSDAQWASYEQNFKPLESELAKRSLEFDSPARREAAARSARGEVAGDFALARQSSRESLAAAGLQPGSGAARASEAQMNIAEATAKAGAANSARDQIESRGLAYLDNATRFGRNMPSTGIAAAGLASQQGGSTTAQFGGLSAAYGAGAQMASPLLQTAISGNNSAGGLYSAQFGQQMQGAQMQAQADNQTWSAVGTLAMAAAMY